MSLKFLSQLFSRGKHLAWTLTALVLGPPVVILFVLVVGMVTDTTIEIDVALVLLAIAAVVLALGAVHLVRHFTSPKATVSVNYELRLEQPAVPLGRYHFRLAVFHEVLERGERRVVQQGAIEMKFRGRDHPDLLAWCTSQVSTHLERHREVAERQYPGARVLVQPPPRHVEIEPS